MVENRLGSVTQPLTYPKTFKNQKKGIGLVTLHTKQLFKQATSQKTSNRLQIKFHCRSNFTKYGDQAKSPHFRLQSCPKISLTPPRSNANSLILLFFTALFPSLILAMKQCQCLSHVPLPWQVTADDAIVLIRYHL